MQSGTVNPPTTQSTSPVIQSSQSEVLAGLDPRGDTPLDWIKANTEPVPPSPGNTPQETFQKVTDAYVANNNPKPETPGGQPVQQPGNAPQAERTDPVPSLEFNTQPQGAEAPKEAAQETPEDEPDELKDIPNEWNAENVKKLRKITTVKIKEAKAIAAEKERLEQELIAAKAGTITPEVVQEKEARIQELERYEKLHNLKGSKEYAKKYVEPTKALKNEIGTIFNDAGIPDEDIDRLIEAAIQTDNKVELNQFLSNNFDAVTALEVKQKVLKAKELRQEMMQAEAEPAQMHERLIQESAQAAKVQRIQQLAVIETTMKDSWVGALLDIRKEGKIPELTHRPGDDDFNNTIVTPRLQAASQDYSRLVKELADAGLEKLPKDLATTLATAILRSHATSSAIETRKNALDYIEELEQNTKRQHSILRPSVGGHNGRSGGLPSRSSDIPSLEDEANTLLNGVLSKGSR